jgi:hypothetical protein
MPLLLLLLLPLLLIAGCASPGRELQRGSAVAPPPPPVRPGHGAPVVGQPGQQSPELPRSPHHRVLPPSREPGLWAGDEPRAGRSGPQAEPVLLGVTLPGLPITDTEKDVGPARACVAMWNDALPGTRLAAKVNALRPAEKQCMVALMFRDCARVIEELDDASREKGVVVLLARQMRAKLRQTADGFAREACARVPVTDDQRRLLDRLRAALRRSSEEPE